MLHNHTGFSALDGFGSPAEHVKITKEKGLDGYSISDHALTSGYYKAEEACIKEGIPFLAGVETYFAEDRFEKHKNTMFGFNPAHMFVVAKNVNGLKSINNLVYKSYYEGFYNKPRIDFDLLKENSEGLICTTGCVSSAVGKYVQRGDYQRARDWIVNAQEIFGEDFYLEVQPHDFPEQHNQNKFLSSVDPSILIAANDVHYPSPEDADAQFVSVCVGTKSTVANPALTYDNDHSIKSYDETLENLQTKGNLPDKYAIIAVENAKKILSSSSVDLPKGFDLAPGWHNAEEDLKKAIDLGIKEKLIPKVKNQKSLNVYLSRVKYEYSLISSKGFAEYFLVTKDMIDAAKNKNVFVNCGRGSVCGCLIAYLIGITEVDPVYWNLPFERFISPDRGGYQMAFHEPNEISDLINWFDEEEK